MIYNQQQQNHNYNNCNNNTTIQINDKKRDHVKVLKETLPRSGLLSIVKKETSQICA